MEGKRVSGNTAYDYTPYTPPKNLQKHRSNNFKQDGGVQFYRKEQEGYNPSMSYVEGPSRGRQQSPAPPRRPANYPSYNQTEKQKFEPSLGNQFQYTKRNPNIPESERVPNERLPLNQPSDQVYGFEQNDLEEVQNDGGYISYDENEEEYYTIGDYVRTDVGDYDSSNKPEYEELNQIVEEGDYVSIIEDQYSTDDGESYDNYGYRGDYNPQVVNTAYGEPFNPACYGGQRNFPCDQQEQFNPGFYSASTIPTASQEQTYRERFQNYQQNSPKNPESSSCPVLPDNMNQQKRKDIFKQVSKKINETVAELRNAGIEKKSDQMRESNPNLDYIRRYNKNIRSIETTKEPLFQRRIPQRVVHQEKTLPQQSRNDEMQRKMQQQQQQQLQFYRQMMQKKRLLDLDNEPPNIQEVPQMQRRTSSPQRLSQHAGQQVINNPQNIKNENFHSFQQHESPSKDGRKSVSHQLSDRNRKKMEKGPPDSFVQLHAVSDQAVQDCCRQAYNDFKKNSPKEETVYK